MAAVPPQRDPEKTAAGDVLAAVWLAEIRALMAEGVLKPPCQKPGHAATVWFGESERPICGVCHPPIGAAE